MSYPCPTQPRMNRSRVYSGVINIECPPSQYVTLIQLTMLTGMIESQKPVGKLHNLRTNLNSQIFRFVSLSLFTELCENKLTCDNIREQLSKLVIVVYVCQWLHEAWIWQAELCVHTPRRVYTMCMDCTRSCTQYTSYTSRARWLSVNTASVTVSSAHWWRPAEQTRDHHPMPVQSWASVAATLAQHCTGIGWSSRVGWEDPSYHNKPHRNAVISHNTGNFHCRLFWAPVGGNIEIIRVVQP